MGAPLLEVSFELAELEADAAFAACVACGASAVTFTDAGDTPVLEPLPGEFRLWPATRVRALFPVEANATSAGVLRALGATLGRPLASLRTELVADALEAAVRT